MAHEIHEHQKMQAPEDNQASANLSAYINDERFKMTPGVLERRVTVDEDGTFHPCTFPHDGFKPQPVAEGVLTFTNPYSKSEVADHALKMMRTGELDENKDGFVSKEEIGSKYLELQAEQDPGVRCFNPDAGLDDKALAFLLKNFDKIENQFADSKTGAGLSKLDLALTALATHDEPVLNWPSRIHLRPRVEPVPFLTKPEHLLHTLGIATKSGLDIKPV
ncbi:MAG: hypothetical protein IAF58_00465 [Leptolyngbya sp.]|nr:hypothetical protein [Candidatus Melainabacteria bacterium]